MRIRKLKTVMLTLILTWTFAIPVHAQTGEGTTGKDYAKATLRLTKSPSATVVGTCITTDTSNGNSARAILFVDNVKVGDTGERPMATVEIAANVKGHGDHEILLQCYNRRATAFSATIGVREPEIIVR